MASKTQGRIEHPGQDGSAGGTYTNHSEHRGEWPVVCIVLVCGVWVCPGTSWDGKPNLGGDHRWSMDRKNVVTLLNRHVHTTIGVRAGLYIKTQFVFLINNSLTIASWDMKLKGLTVSFSCITDMQKLKKALQVLEVDSIPPIYPHKML